MDPINPPDYLKQDPTGEAIRSAAPIGFTGQIIIWSLGLAPAGFLICDGSLVDKDKYSDLYLLLGDTYGTATTTQFYIPNLKGRVPVGYDVTQPEFASIGVAGGHKKMQAHTHSYGTVFPYVAGGTAVPGIPYANTGTRYATHSGTAIDTTGTGNAENLQPYISLTFCIKT